MIIGIIVINTVVFVGSYIPRTVIESNGRIVTYNIVNKISDEYSLNSVKEVQLAAYESHDLKSPGQDFRFQIRLKLVNQMDFYFFLRDFRNVESLISYLRMFNKNMIVFEGDLYEYENYCKQNGIAAEMLIEYLECFQ